MAHDHGSFRTFRRTLESNKKREARKATAIANPHIGAELYKLVTPDGFQDILGFKETYGIRATNNGGILYKPGAVIIPRGDCYLKGAYPTLSGKLPKDYISIAIFGSKGKQTYIRNDVMERLEGNGIVYAGALSYFIPQNLRAKNKLFL